MPRLPTYSPATAPVRCLVNKSVALSVDRTKHARVQLFWPNAVYRGAGGHMCGRLHIAIAQISGPAWQTHAQTRNGCMCLTRTREMRPNAENLIIIDVFKDVRAPYFQAAFLGL